ncbi:MAG: tyrosine--tRNA ligase [Acidobacteria bacterium]|nr:MAG: tyrosine--tRNA ligase [Acidobacteriota bacterium]
MGPGDLEVLTSGCVDVVTPDALRDKLAREEPLTVKVGFDPTAPDIHLGHTVLMRKMKHFQDAGHRVVFVIGDFTGMIGDPTGKSKTRPPLSREEIEANAETYKKQAFRILDPARTETRFNREWLGALGSDGMVRLAATYNVARMLERREFRQRFEAGQPISVHEFLYPLAQAYDSVALRADVELGGTDQLFNLNVGRDIMPAYGLEPQVVMTTPLLEGTDGVEKMSKSLGNYIGVAESPDSMFAKVLSISDVLMWRYYPLLTDLTGAEIEAEKGRGRPMDSKIALARRIIADFHGAAAAEAAEQEWRRVHQAREAPSEMPERSVAPGRHKWRELLVAAGLASSKSEAERLLRQRAVKKDGAPVEAVELEVTADQSFVVSVGAARFVRFRVEGP